MLDVQMPSLTRYISWKLATLNLRGAVLMFVRIVNGMKMFVKTHVGRVQLPHSGAVHPRQLLLEEDNNELALDNPWSGIKV